MERVSSLVYCWALFDAYATDRLGIFTHINFRNCTDSVKGPKQRQNDMCAFDFSVTVFLCNGKRARAHYNLSTE